jgi:hypothetical protein
MRRRIDVLTLYYLFRKIPGEEEVKHAVLP